MRHRLQQRSTHRLFAVRPVADGEDNYGSPTYGTVEPVISNEPVKLNSGGTSWVRQESGERVSRSPTVTGRPRLAGTLLEGDIVSLVPMNDGLTRHDDVEVASIDVEYSPRYTRPQSTEVELDGI